MMRQAGAIRQAGAPRLVIYSVFATATIFFLTNGLSFRGALFLPSSATDSDTTVSDPHSTSTEQTREAESDRPPASPPACCPCKKEAEEAPASRDRPIPTTPPTVPAAPLPKAEDPSLSGKQRYLLNPAISEAFPKMRQDNCDRYIGSASLSPSSFTPWVTCGSAVSCRTGGSKFCVLSGLVFDFRNAAYHTNPDNAGIPKYSRGQTWTTRESCDDPSAVVELANSQFNVNHNHLEYFFSGYSSRSAAASPTCDVTVDRLTVFFTREGTAGSFWHNLMEHIGLYASIVASGLATKSDDFQIVLMDAHHYHPGGQGPGFLKPLMEGLSDHPILDQRDFAGKIACFRQAIVPAYGWSIYFWTNVWKDEPCKEPSPLLLQFRQYVLGGLRLPVRWERWRAGTPIKVLFLSRTKSRRLNNQDELMKFLASYSSSDHEQGSGRLTIISRMEVFESGIPFREQVRLIQETDVLIGVHGAGLTHAFCMAAGGGVLELRDAQHHATARYFENWSAFSGLEYQHLVIGGADPGGFTVSIPDFAAAFQRLLDAMEKRARASPVAALNAVAG